MFGVCSNSAKIYVLGALVACATKSDAARGDVADLLRARKGSRALSALVCSMCGFGEHEVASGAVRKSLASM